MEIEQLDLETRSKIYSQTKKILRKYQKGITTGKLTSDKFADNLLTNEYIKDILPESILNEQSFKQSYMQYIDTLINIQNKNLSESKKRKYRKLDTSDKPNISQKIKLQKLLKNKGYTLSIPYKYLTISDVEGLLKYMSTGYIDIGNERIYNYVRKDNLH